VRGVRGVINGLGRSVVTRKQVWLEAKLQTAPPGWTGAGTLAVLRFRDQQSVEGLA
jgi:hypothetical protein